MRLAFTSQGNSEIFPKTNGRRLKLTIPLIFGKIEFSQMCFSAGTKSFETLVTGQFYSRSLFHKWASVMMKAGNCVAAGWHYCLLPSNFNVFDGTLDTIFKRLMPHLTRETHQEDPHKSSKTFIKGILHFTEGRFVGKLLVYNFKLG